MHLVLGNNDERQRMTDTDRFATVAEMRELDVNGQRLFLCHYPMRDWPNAKRGAWHLFGHVHGRLNREPIGLSMDVGVDSHGFAPVAYETIEEILTLRARTANAAAAG